METTKEKHYYAFISYKREDEEWAKWVQEEFEKYLLPATLNGRDDLPKSFHPVFRDIDELKAGNLPTQIHNALASSLNLVVICSPRLADDENAKWVNQEILDFIEIGKKEGVDNVKHIFPFIVDGKPHAGDERECFPMVLRELAKEQERIGGNINEGGDVGQINRERAFVKVLAGTLPDSISFDMLWDRYDRAKMERERKEKEERDKLLIAQSRFVAEKAMSILEEGDSYLARVLALEVLPKDLANPDRPFTPEAGAVLYNTFLNGTTVLRCQSHDLVGAQFSPDGNSIVSASTQGGVEVWNAMDGNKLFVIQDCGFVNDVSYSHDGKRILVTSMSHGILVYDSKTGSEIQKIRVGGNPLCARYSLDDNLIAVGTQLSNGVSSEASSIYFLDASTGEVLKELEGHMGSVRSVAFSPYGEKLVSGSDDKTVKLWDVETGELLRTYEGHKAEVISVAYSPDGKYIASGSLDGTVRLWFPYIDMEAGLFNEHKSEIVSVNFSPDGERVVIAYCDNTVRIWNHAMMKEEYTFEGHERPVFSAAFDQNGERVISAAKDGTVRIWEVEPKAFEPKLEIETHSYPMEYAAITTDGQKIVTASDEYVKIWDAYTGDELHSVRVTENGYAGQIAISPDDKLAVVATYSTPSKLLDLETGKIMKVFSWPESASYVAAFSPDGDKVLLAHSSNVGIWDINTGKQLFSFVTGDSGSPHSVRYSFDGTKIITTKNHIAQIWDSKTGALIQTLTGHSSEVYDAVFSPDGKWAATASGDFTAKIWDVATGKEIRSFIGHADRVSSVAFSPDQGRLITCSNDNSVRVWDVGSGREMCGLVGHRKGVERAFFDLSGKRVVSVAGDSVIRIWDFPSLQDLIDQTRERFKDRPLTEEERRQYYLE